MEKTFIKEALHRDKIHIYRFYKCVHQKTGNVFYIREKSKSNNRPSSKSYAKTIDEKKWEGIFIRFEKTL